MVIWGLAGLDYPDPRARAIGRCGGLNTRRAIWKWNTGCSACGLALLIG
jgi:hypothetical protein